MTGFILTYYLMGLILAGLSHAALYEYNIKFKSVQEYILKVWIAIGLFYPLTGLILFITFIISIARKLIEK